MYIVYNRSWNETWTYLQVYDQTLEYFSEREAENETPVHVINMNVVDNPEDATIGVGRFFGWSNEHGIGATMFVKFENERKEILKTT